MNEHTNLQIRDVVKAFVLSEPCLFHNSKENLMPVTETTTNVEGLIMNTYEVDAWISTGYTFTIKASSAEEARKKVENGEVIIDYKKLSVDAYWDLGDVHLDSVREITTKGDNNEQ